MKEFIQSHKKLIISALIVLSIYFIWHMIQNHRNAKSLMQDAVVVEADKVKQGPITIEAQAVGTLTASQNVELSSEVAGQIAQILVRDGSFVKQGTPLVQLDDTVNKAKAESDVAALTFSEQNYNRMALLGKKGVVSQQSIDQALSELKQKKAAAQQSHLLAQKMTITAPFDGMLGKINVNVGEYVNVGQKIVPLTDTRNLRVEFNVSEKYFSKLKIGQQVTMTTSNYPGKDFFGKVAFISPTINTSDRTIAVYADVPNQDNMLTAGLFMNVKLLLGIENNALIIPSIALVATIDGQQVYKIVGGKAVGVPVVIGQRTENTVQIIDGLSFNDVVVTAGQEKIKDGVSVKSH